MKKLKLSLANMEGVEVLTREQLKKVIGGNVPTEGELEPPGGPNCTTQCTKDEDCTGGDNNCKKCSTTLTIDGKRVCVTSD